MDNKEIFGNIEKRLKKGEILLFSGTHFSSEPYTLKYVIINKKNPYIDAVVTLKFDKSEEGKKLLLDVYKSAGYEDRLIPKEIQRINPQINHLSAKPE